MNNDTLRLIVGSNMVKIRQALNLKQEELAEIMECNVTAISKIENKGRDITARELYLLELKLKVNARGVIGVSEYLFLTPNQKKNNINEGIDFRKKRSKPSGVQNGDI